MGRQKKTDQRLWWLLAIAGLASLAWLAGTMALVGATLDEEGRATVWRLMGERAVVLLLAWCGGMGAIAWALKRWFDHWVTPAVQLAEEAQVLLKTNVVRTLPPNGNGETQVLAGLFNQLVAQREALRQEMDAKVELAADHIEQERSRLAALMSELTQSVVVCNLDGVVLLYNNRARMQFRALSKTPRVAGGAELMGLGRSIYGAFDRKLVDHALGNIRSRLQRGAAEPTTHFVTATPSGQWLRVQMAPVRNLATAGSSTEREMTGFVLMLDNITQTFEAEAARDKWLHAFTESSRSALANMQVALDLLESPDTEASARARAVGALREEALSLGRQVGEVETASAVLQASRWPMEEVLGADLVSAALKRLEASAGVPASTLEVEPNVWLKVESFSLLQALSYLASRLVGEFGVRFVQLRLSEAPDAPGKAQLDLVWTGQAMSTETVMGWEMDTMTDGDELLGLSVRDVVARHGGAFGFERDRAMHQAFFRFQLPVANPHSLLEDRATLAPTDSRPEFYDFDLFKTTEQTHALDDRLLTELSYTVFDTETTGLNPSQGDEIIQIGAARVVNNKLLKQECFEQLVDPQRSIPAATIPIHGISPDMVKGQPTIAQVLPAFHAFAQDTVLVAHNAAFDLRFLQLKEQLTGKVFDNPVLDTLLLSAVVHPNQDSHRLEALSERFNVPNMGRHTAMGDAMVTAEVFVKLIPLLAEKGILTLGQAREAAQKTYYARLKY